MLSVALAEALIQKHVSPLPACSVQLKDLNQVVLRQEVRADRPLPPFDRVAMDGIALAWSSWKAGQRSFVLTGIQRAGEAQQTLNDPQACIEVMTGAVLPVGCDCVVRVEDLQFDQGMATISADLQLEYLQNIHRAGSDCAQNSVLLPPQTVMGPLQWAVAASVGAFRVQVTQSPRISLVSTGDELVPVEATPLPHQIRASNLWMMAASLKQEGFEQVSRHHLGDQAAAMKQGLADLLEQSEVLILSGGVSMGKFDLVPEVLQSLNVQPIFHKVAQRPGKPLWFGVGPGQQLVFGLPGNPVSASVCLRRYVLPALQQMLGRPWPKPWHAVLQQTVKFGKAMSWFLPVIVSCSAQGQLLAEPAETNGSGDFASLARSDGFLELPPEPGSFQQGEVYPLWLWKP